MNLELNALRAEALAIVQKAMDERRPDLNAVEAAHYDLLDREICRITGGTPFAASRTTSRSGDGWRVLDSPKYPNRDLEQLAHELWRRAFRTPGGWPEWRVRFAELDDYAALTLYGHQLILIDEARLLQREDLEADLRESLLHEGAHIAVGPDMHEHSPLFNYTYNDARARCPQVIRTWTAAR